MRWISNHRHATLTAMTYDALRSSPSPLYAQVAEALRQRIEKGHWKAGERLPSFDALAKEFGVAKITIRQAVKILTEDGLAHAQRGRGTTVLAQVPKQRPLKVETKLADLVDMYRGDKPDVQNLEDCVAALPEDVLEPDAGLFHMIKRIHARNNDPYCVIRLYLALDIFNRYEQRFRNEVVLPVLFDDPGLEVSSARQRLVITKCDMETAQLLGLSIGDPMAEVRRIIRSTDGKIVYLADVIYRGDFIRLDMDLLA